MKIYTYFQKMYDMLLCPFFSHLSSSFSSFWFDLICRLHPFQSGEDSRVFGCLLPKNAIVYVSKASHSHTHSYRVTGSSSAAHRIAHRQKRRSILYLFKPFEQVMRNCFKRMKRKKQQQLWWNFHLQFWTLTRDVSSFLLHQKKNFSYWLLSKHFILDSYFMYNV